MELKKRTKGERKAYLEGCQAGTVLTANLITKMAMESEAEPKIKIELLKVAKYITNLAQVAIRGGEIPRG